jgi:hypothetical protein
MTQADRVLSTPPTNTPIDSKRRRFLAVAAGASIVSVGSLVVAAAPPNATPEVSSAPVDPIFAAISACREAREVADIAYSRTSALYREAKEKFGDDDTRKTRRMHRDYIEGVLGMDGDDYTDGPAFALYEAYDNFTLTEPTTLAGLFAMLIYCEELVERDPDALELVDFVPTFAAAAKSLSKGGLA